MDLLNLIKGEKPLAIVGRGPSAKYFQNQNYFNVIGYNVTPEELEIDVVYRSMRYDRKAGDLSFTLIEGLISDFPGDFRLFKENFELGLLLFSLDCILKAEEIESKVYLFGFDFHSNKVDDDAFLSEFSFMSDNRGVAFTLQSELYGLTLSYLSCLQVIRAGFDLWSDVDPRYPLEQSISICGQNEVEIVAELTTNHHGDSNKLLQLIEYSAKAGANSIKLQKRDVLSFYSAEKLKEKYLSPFGGTFLDYRLGLELSMEQILEADELCKNLGLKLFFSVLDLQSLNFLKTIEGLEISRIKLPSTISRKKKYLEFVSQNWTHELVISTGMTDMQYENWLLRTFRHQSKLFLMHCTSSYPTFGRDVNINVLNRYSRIAEVRSDIIPSFSSHDNQWFGSVMAVAAGARMVEKHVKLRSEKWSHFDDCALSVKDDFRLYCRAIRESERYLGSSEKYILKSEHHKY